MKKTQENNYLQHPVDTSDVSLPAELENLVEQVAKNVQDVWASSRISQGWTWGPKRNDELKTHPSLIPYEELSEEEKQYDRDTAVGTLKLVMKLGFNISK